MNKKKRVLTFAEAINEALDRIHAVAAGIPVAGSILYLEEEELMAELESMDN